MIDDVRLIFISINEEFLYPLWESKGYRLGAKGRFFKEEADSEFRLASHLIRRGRQSFGETSFSAGVGFKRLWKFIRRFSAFEHTEMYSAAGCGGRIERMIPWKARRVKWSLVDPASDSETIGKELVYQFENRVFPFLEHYKKLVNAISFWEDDRHLNGMARSAAILLLGEREKALADVDAQIERALEKTKEDPRPGSFMILDEWRRFRVYLESADTTKFSYVS